MIGNLIINRKTLISMIFIAATMLGFVSYRLLPVELFPNAELPFLIVQAYSYQEADPGDMERDIIVPLEGAIGTLENIDRIESTIYPRSGMITVFYNKGTGIKYAYLKLQEKISTAKSSLPDNYFVQVFKVDTEQMSNQFMNLQIRGGGGLDRVRQIVDREIKKELESIDGISNVDVSGGREKSVEITLDDEICEAYGITPSTISSLIRQNSASNTFVGQVRESGSKYFVNVIAEYRDISDIENITVIRDGPVLLKDISDIYFGVKEQESISRVNGKDAVTVNLVRDAQVNLIDLSHKTREVISKLNRKFIDRDINIIIQNDTAEVMEKNIDLIVRLALIGGLIAIAILWIFLRNLRLVLIIALAIPISVFTAFNFFYAAGISINSLTLIGMALAVGMLLDNSIVVLENIYRLKTAGKGTDIAVIQGVKEVWRSVFAATLTTVTVFVPFIFSSNFIIQLIGKHIGVSIISTLLISLVLALLLVPMVTHFFLVRRKTADSAGFRSDSGSSRLVEIYYVLLKSCLRFPLRTIIGTIVVFFASIIICFGISLNVTEEAESNSFSIYVTMPEGATIETTDRTVADLEQRFESLAEREDMISDIREDEAVITISLKDDYQKIDGRNMQEIKEDIRKRFSIIRAANVGFDAPQSSRRFRGGGGGGGMSRAMGRMFGIGSQQEQIVIKGNDIEVMQNFAENIEYYLDNLGSISSTSINISENRPEIHLLFDTKVMSYYGITLSSVASELNSFQNEYSTRMQFKQGTDTYDIMIRKKNQEDKKIEDLRALPVGASAGGSVDLENLSRIIYSHGMPTISRVNQEKQVEITFAFSSDINNSKSMLEASRLEVDDLVSSLVIPTGLAVEVIHEENDYSEFKFLILVAFILIYMILASVFESLSTPVVMMFTIPLAAIGSFWLLIATGTSLINAYTLTGFLILLGVVVNNGIILIDYSLILMRRGYRRPRALMIAGKARTRPILITAITTIAAMIPLAMGKSEEITLIGAPFAITVIGGLTLSTVFTLIFIPVVYSGLESALSWIRSLSWKIKSAQILAFALGSLAIYFKATGTIWQMVFLATLIFAVPGLTWFMISSLRTAKKDIIAENEPVRITIRNLVKIYDQSPRFIREWNKGKRKRKRQAEGQECETDNFDTGSMIWKLPLLFFMIYFIYFYLRSPFWIFVLSHAVYFYTFFLWKPSAAYLIRRIKIGRRVPMTKIRSACRRRSRMIIVISLFRPIFLWGFPLLNLFIFWLRWRNIASLVFVAALWYFALIVYTSAGRLQREQINIARISGRAAGLRKAFYYLVKSIPVIGKKKEAFRALSGVSLEIGEGMFGLLGPNGAGKTTLMRIICGILDQSYGKIDINGIDINDKREELQSLIGYLPQEFGMYENLTAWEFLNYQAVLKGLTIREYREEMVEKVLGMVHMEESRDQAISSFSGGMKQRVGIAQVLLHLPRILVVDEPTAGLDPRERIRFRNLLVELSRERIVIFSTHIIEDIYSSCNSVAVLNKGNLIYLDDPSRMAEIAEGHVWQFETDPEELERIRKEMMIVHHMRDGKKIKVRSLSETKPHPYAKTVRPTLEDSYLWLLGTGGTE